MFVSTARRDLLDHVILLNEKHLQRLVAGFASYYLNDRTHFSLEKDTPAVRVVQPKTASSGRDHGFCLASADFIIATLGVARPDGSARPVHCRGLVVEGVCLCGKSHRRARCQPLGMTVADKRRGAFGRRVGLPIPSLASHQQGADSIVAKDIGLHGKGHTGRYRHRHAKVAAAPMMSVDTMSSASNSGQTKRRYLS